MRMCVVGLSECKRKCELVCLRESKRRIMSSCSAYSVSPTPQVVPGTFPVVVGDAVEALVLLTPSQVRLQAAIILGHYLSLYIMHSQH